MPYETATPIVHRLSAGTALHLQLTEGSELFCRQGQLQLTIPQQCWNDGVAPACIGLSTGQGWRAGSDLQVQVSTLSGACLQLQALPPQPGRSPREQAARPLQWPLGVWLRGLRRGRRAA